MSTKRVVLAGLAAGVLNLALTLSMAFLVLLEDVRAQVERFQLQPPPYALFTVVGMQLLLGIAVVWLYAAIRPRFGPGPRTAILAGPAVWFLSYLVYCELVVRLGISPLPMAAKMAVWGFFQMPVVALAGGWLYRE